MTYLALLRHGQSEYNALGLWTGLTDISLNEAGLAEAKVAAGDLKDIHFDVVFTSALKRAQETADEILRANGQTDVRIIRAPELNERDYGDLTAKNKWEVREQYGEEQFLLWRRSWDYPVPGGETLKDVYARVVPYYESHIVPELKQGHTTMVVAHGNSLRALVKHLETIADDVIPSLEIATGEIYLYDVDPSGKIVSKEIRAAHPNLV
jgi:2,3-bisphosphoglycerate-dependent phosphoglycerate mutase